jgi:two-component system CheB/CheR fusion protein
MSNEHKKPTVVGIGASAGGLSALKNLFSNVPSDSGLAFVVVVHLSPDHESHLAELLQPHVKIPVQQVTDTTPLQPNHVYVIPPNSNLSAIDTHLRLSPLEVRRQERAPIDHFFRALSSAHDGNGIAVVLTGTGSDGTLGVKDIKANGGLVIVQDPNEAEYDGMPQSAIATGLVDFILPVAEIPDRILRFDRTQPRIAVVPETEVSTDDRILLQKVFAQLRARTDRDFSRYKRSTILRRIARRMQLNYLEDLSKYIEKLRERPEEVRALADDLLITVTHFFRDPEVFEKLRSEELPRIFATKTSSESIRLWSVGCATGEEAYSLAILFAEEALRRDNPPAIQIFASDLHTRSLERAREGFYPGDIETDVSPDRLKRFFQKENGGFRINKEIRDMVVFAPHNLLADPPFSRMDLISCRNLLIYLEREVQHDVIELFHYALNPDGALLLGSAETMDAADLFRAEDKRLCMFRKRNVPPPPRASLACLSSRGCAPLRCGGAVCRALVFTYPLRYPASGDGRALRPSQYSDWPRRQTRASFRQRRSLPHASRWRTYARRGSSGSRRA